MFLQIIPKELAQRLKGDIRGETELETQNRCSHKIEVVKNREEQLMLVAGWRRFVEKFHLQTRDSIVFRYKGNSKFSINIFDKLGREKALSVVVDPFLSRG